MAFHTHAARQVMKFNPVDKSIVCIGPDFGEKIMEVS